MLRLILNREPRWVTLTCGADLLVAPLTTAIWSMASASPAVAALPADCAADLRFCHLTAAVAQLVIEDWRGVVGEDDAPLPVTPEAVMALMDLTSVSHDFAAQVITPYLLMVAEKKGLPPSSPGTLATGRNTAETATGDAPTAPVH